MTPSASVKPIPRWIWLLAFTLLIPVYVAVPYLLYAVGQKFAQESPFDFTRLWGVYVNILIGSFVCTRVWARISHQRFNIHVPMIPVAANLSCTNPSFCPSWLEATKCSAVGTVVSILFVAFGALLIRLVMDREGIRLKKAISPMWDADTDRPLVTKEPI